MFSLAAQAQTSPKYVDIQTTVQCADTADVIKYLQGTHKEFPVMVGVAEKLLMVVWKHTQTGDFSVTLSSNDGSMTCMVIVGSKLRTVNEKGL
jgi:hypothetical protein